MPCLLLDGMRLVKTVRFKNPRYLGDPRNAVRIFNEKEVDELILLDIRATVEARPIQFELIAEIVSEAFMPIAYGGGLRDLTTCRRILAVGVEKVVLCSSAVADPELVRVAAEEFGSQSVVVCMDVKRGLLRGYEVCTHSGTRKTGRDPVALAQELAAAGAGEIVCNSIDRDGQMNGYDVELLRRVSEAVSVPVVACGGAGSVQHLREAVIAGGASAVAAGSLFVYHGKHRAVLINYPAPETLEAVLTT